MGGFQQWFSMLVQFLVLLELSICFQIEVQIVVSLDVAFITKDDRSMWLTFAEVPLTHASMR